MFYLCITFYFKSLIDMSKELFSTLPYKVADITLADFGRKEIDLAEQEMPGRKVWRNKTVERRSYHGFSAHDHPDSGTD